MNMNYPKTLTNEVVFTSQRVSIRHDQIQIAQDQVLHREIVVSHDSVAIVALDKNKNILLVRQFRAPVSERLLEIPAGTIEFGETPLECAERELREETGYAAEEIIAIGDFWTTPGFCTERMYIFLATQLREDPLPADPDEFIQVERMKFAEALVKASNGEFRDAKTIAALFLAQKQLGA
jgi:ADP-ribose pyrophosphatase